MKRKLSGILGLFLTMFTIASTLNSCEVEHTYEAEITVLNAMGYAIPGVTVITKVDVDQHHNVYREAITDGFGKVHFEYDNVAVLKVIATFENFSGEQLLVLEEDEEVKLNVVIYE